MTTCVKDHLKAVGPPRVVLLLNYERNAMSAGDRCRVLVGGQVCYRDRRPLTFGGTGAFAPFALAAFRVMV